MINGPTGKKKNVTFYTLVEFMFFVISPSLTYKTVLTFSVGEQMNRTHTCASTFLCYLFVVIKQAPRATQAGSGTVGGTGRTMLFAVG